MDNFFSDNNFETITQVGSNMLISDYQKIADTFMEYFNTIVSKLGLAVPKDAIFAINGFEDPALKEFHKY